MENKNISRRQLLTVAAGGVVAGGLLGAGSVAMSKGIGGSAGNAGNAPALPWQYTKLDPAVAAKRGYEFYFTQGG